MSLSALLRRVVEILDDCDIPYMLTGSLAAAYYATPRATKDIDLVVEADESRLNDLVGRLQEAGLYADPGAALEALDRRVARQLGGRPDCEAGVEQDG